jgi:hypothetical protein
LREAEGTQELYIRNDPDSKEAYYTIEEPNVHLEVGTTLGKLQFIWDRHKSNENLAKHLFTHYLTRHVYNEDEYRVLDGQLIGKEIARIRTDDGNTGLLCALDLCALDIDVFQKTDEEELPEKVVVIVRQEKLNNKRIRLISCYPTENRDHIRWYHKNFAIRVRRGSKRPDNLDKKDLACISPEHMTEKLKQIWSIQTEVWNEVIEELVENSIVAKNKFIKFLKKKTMPQW